MAVAPGSFAKNLSVISQLLGPQNCLRTMHSQKAQNYESDGGRGAEIF